MTPAQLRAYSAVVRLGSVHAAAGELGMSDAGISADCGIDDVRRADDLSVELSVQPTSRFRDLILSRTVDIALGPPVDGDAGTLVMRPFLRYQILTVTSPANPMLHAGATVAQLREQPWILGPAAGSVDGEIAKLPARLEVPDARQRIFPSDAAALNEVERAGA